LENNVGFVYGPQVGSKVVKARKGIKEVRLDQVPILFEEGGPQVKVVKARLVVHGENGRTDLFKREGSDQGSNLRGCERSGGDKGGQVKLTSRCDRSAEEVFKEIVKKRGFCLMSENHIAILIVKVFNLVYSKAARGA
jgi:hypothetical protein